MSHRSSPPTRPLGAIFTAAFALTALAPSPAEATTAGPIIQLATPPGGQRAPTVSWDAQEQVYVIVWEDRRNAGSSGIDLYVARIDPDGTLRDPMGTPLLDATVNADNETQPSIVYNPQTFAHLVSWTEARAGLTDIFVTRIFANRTQMAPTIVPTAGIQVTTGEDSEVESDVAVGLQTFLVSYQTNIVAGGRRIRGRRIYPDGSFLDDTFFTISQDGAGSPASLGIGSNFIVGYAANGDIFARTVPDFGPVQSSSVATIVPVATATLGQNAVDIGQVGAANVFFTWADNRAFSTLQADVYGARFTPTLTPLGMDQVVSTGTAAQQFPAIAGNDMGTLAVWQDRRFSTSNASIFGARVDAATGNVLDPEGFPVLTLTANAFEPTVAKGPAADFLVAGVRFDAAEPRIFYRIVRDELPDGAMNAMGNLSVPADGVTTADPTFGPAVGPSGLSVVDGTLYTVTLSNNAAQIVQPDADPNLAGHQVPAANGQVLVSLTSVDHVLVDVTVASVEGMSSGTVQVEFLNVPPEASNVVLGPTMPRSVEPLQLTYDYFDVNSDPEMGSTVQWTADSLLQPGVQNQVTIPPSATRKGEIWRATLRPRDGMDFGMQQISNTVVIQNTPPAALDARIIPDEDVRTGDALEGRYIFRDPDADAESGTQIRWYLDGAEQGALRNQLDVPGSRVIKGQRWWFTVRPSDADPVEPFGPLVSSSTITIVNTAPVANAGENGSVLERRRFSLDGRASSDIDPQDVLEYRWAQIQTGSEPLVELSDTASVTPSFLAPSVEGTTFLTFDLIVRDDEVSSTADRVTVEIEPVPDGDADGLDDEEEMEAGTSLTVADTDRDGLRDGEEVKGILMGGVRRPLGTDPLDADSDDDGLRDGAEGRATRDGTEFDPAGDPDGDTIPNALDPDSDGDGILDGTELGIRNPISGGSNGGIDYVGTDEASPNFVPDADADSRTNPLVVDTDEDTFDDGVEDANKNGAVDEGESDPTDPTDPGTPCANDDVCPGDLRCVEGVCGTGSGTGPMCTPLPETLECCTGGCEGGSLVEAVCITDGARERCPVGADQCAAGSCSAPTTPPGDGGGCVCVEPSEAPAGAWGALALLGLVLLRRRRR